MLDPISAAHFQFVSGPIFDSNVKELSDILTKFDPMKNYKECAPIFESVRPSDGYYQEAQYLLTLCEVSKSILEPNRSIGSSISPSIARKAVAACEAISKNKGDEAYRNFMVYAIMCQAKLHLSWADLENHMLQSFTARYNEINIQSRRLYAAGINGHQVTSQARSAMNDVAAMNAKLDDTDKGVKDYVARTFLALVENLRNPDAHDKDILDLLPKYAHAYESFGVPASQNLSAKTAEALDRNRAAYRSSPAYRSIVHQRWKANPSERKRIESRIASLREHASQVDDSVEEARKELVAAKAAQKKALSPLLKRVGAIEAEIKSAEDELKGLGLFSGKRKRELRAVMASKQKELDEAKQELASVTAEHDKAIASAQQIVTAKMKEGEAHLRNIEELYKQLDDPNIPRSFIEAHKK